MNEMEFNLVINYQQVEIYNLENMDTQIKKRQ